MVPYIPYAVFTFIFVIQLFFLHIFICIGSTNKEDKAKIAKYFVYFWDFYELTMVAIDDKG